MLLCGGFMIEKGYIVIPKYPHTFSGLKCCVEDVGCLNGSFIFIRPLEHFTYGLFVHPDNVDRVYT